jgi:deoxyadenosine/deoxycytidine kinase
MVSSLECKKPQLDESSMMISPVKQEAQKSNINDLRKESPKLKARRIRDKSSSSNKSKNSQKVVQERKIFMDVILKKSHLFNASENMQDASPLPKETLPRVPKELSGKDDPQFFISKFEELYQRIIRRDK